MANRKLKRILNFSGWLLLAGAMIVLLVAAMKKREEQTCIAVEVEIEGASQTLFIDKKDVLDILTRQGGEELKGKSVSAIALDDLENRLEKNVWIHNAELFLDKNAVLQVRISENVPVARVFSINGNSWYMDGEGARLPLSDRFSARLPVFTGFPTDRKNLGKQDSIVQERMIELALFLRNDPFWMAQAGAFHITGAKQFEMHPAIGSHVVELGDARSLEERFGRLKIFYDQVMRQTGPNAWSRVKVQYGRQVVAIRTGMEAGVLKTGVPKVVNSNAATQPPRQATVAPPNNGRTPKAVMPARR